MNESLVRKYISVVRRACDLMEAELNNKPLQDASFMSLPNPSQAIVIEDIQANEEVARQAEEETIRLEQEKHKQARRDHLAALMAIDCWPESVPAHLVGIELTDRDKINRSNAILDMTLMAPVDGATVLDFGCGDGWTAAELINRGVFKCCGYDLVQHPDWNRHAKVNFTTDLSSLPSNSFHVIFLYDVLDHATDPVQIMSDVKRLLLPEGLVYVRNHPWCSKHATHLPRLGLNKAFFHLFASGDELAEMGYKPPFTRIEPNYAEAYRWWFREFKTERIREWDEPLSDFFLVPSFMQLVIEQQGLEGARKTEFFHDMRIKFVDHTLRHKS